ncbi:uncharacterized protein N7496_011183 [Penicillium cataractarum]|uniref:Uncharacterized protein n=1 Tax=Penicillium cataractarum TaxID=2100454 RepID=A0A9W9RFT8_9EURO|nr:uncharacterized protein N7496_011183 [Penicillium cataractarum]KAJ5358770.1 hypothetical protein N7496_011183 [Penicillium cataractarum]
MAVDFDGRTAIDKAWLGLAMGWTSAGGNLIDVEGQVGWKNRENGDRPALTGSRDDLRGP